MNPSLLSLLGGMQQPATQLFSNLATETKSDGSPTGLAKASQSVSKSGFGKVLGSNAAATGMGFAKTLIPEKGPTNMQSETARSVVSSAANALIPGLGQGLELLGSAVKSVTRKDDGTYKSTGAAIAENLNPVNLIGNIASGDFSGKKMAKRIAIEKTAADRRREVDTYLSGVQAKAAKLAEQNDDEFAVAYAQKGGKVKKSGCGCNKQGDGIDTDVFKTFDQDMMKVLQKFIGTVEDGVYKEVDKDKMKANAKRKKKRLRDYLDSEPTIKGMIIEVESMRKGGKASTKSKKDKCYYKVKARYKKWPSAYGSLALSKCRNVGASNWGNKVDKKQEGGIIKSISYDSLNQQYKNLSWIDRGLNPNKYPKLEAGKDSNGNPMFKTHRLAAETPDGENWYVFPTIDYDPKTKQWKEFQDPWEAYEHFKNKKELLPFGKDGDKAIEYSKNGLIKHYQQGGSISIDSKNKGAFLKYCTDNGFSSVNKSCVDKGLKSKNALTRKRANFAKNFGTGNK